VKGKTISYTMRVLTLDFWNTLYRHRGTVDYRLKVCAAHLRDYCNARGLSDAESLASTFFPVIDEFIRNRWHQSVCPSPDDIIAHAVDHYGAKLSPAAVPELMAQINRVYTTALKPELFEGAVDFVYWARTRFPVYIISDTYTLRGEALEAILEADNLREAFKDCFYSDTLRVEKPNTAAIERVLAVEKLRPFEITHVGDLWERDYELARGAGCRFIHLQHDRELQNAGTEADEQVMIARCNSFRELRTILESI
jgi:FMN phosphatase YigB (HAD superfamily)